MAHEQWRERLDRSESEYVPLITNCLLAVLILSAIRDPIVITAVPEALIVINGIAIALLVGMVAWTRWGHLSVKNGNRFIVLGVSIFAVKAIAIVYFEAEPYPMIMAVLMFSLGLCFVSHVYLLGTALLITLAWTIVALVTVTPTEVIATLLAIVIGSVLGLFVLERRIEALERVFVLEARVADLETILPMCANCKKTRDERGAWHNVEEYIEQQRGTQVTHGVCPECSQALYGELLNKKEQAAAD